MDSLSGELRVVGGSRTRRGVRRQGRRARHLTAQAGNSRRVEAGTDAACGVAAGGSAHTSNAHAASRGTDAEPAEPKAGQAARTPETDKPLPEKARTTGGGGPTVVDPAGEKQWKPRLWFSPEELHEPELLPKDGRSFIEAINRQIQLVGAGTKLLTEEDPRIRQKVWEQLIDIAFGQKGAPVRTEQKRPPKLTWNLPR